jgi:thiol-disulfide isomerase/thioredoxin
MFLIFLIAASNCFSQSISISIKNLQTQPVRLYLLSGEKQEFVDSISMLDSGRIIFNLADNNSPGIYRVFINNSKWVDFIYDRKDVILETNLNYIFDSIKVISCASNKLYYKFITLNKSYKNKSELLERILARYPKEDKFYEQTRERLNELQIEYLLYVNSISQTDTNSFIARYIRSAQLPIIDNSIPLDHQLDYLKQSALDRVNFNDAELINSDCFTNKSIEYLQYFRNPQLPKEMLEKEFMKAVDTLLIKSSVNILVYQHIADYLIYGFKKFGFDNVVDYVIENYVVKDDLCLDEETENSIQKRINQSKLLAIGSKAPNLELADSTGRQFTLADIKADKILLVFYTSWCLHCRELLPELADIYNKQTNKEFEVVSVSLDEDKNEWQKFIVGINAGWLNSFDGLGWDSPAASRYYIYATPTMFFLDKDLKILAKPLNIAETLNIIN